MNRKNKERNKERMRKGMKGIKKKETTKER